MRPSLVWLDCLRDDIAPLARFSRVQIIIPRVLARNYEHRRRDTRLSVLRSFTTHNDVYRFHPTGGKHSKEPLGLVHSDLCGKMSTESLSGAGYFLTFIDVR